MILRRATAADAVLLQQMLALAVDWRVGVAPRPVEELIAVPELARYVAGWPRDGDVGFVVEDGRRPLGAAWWRSFTEADAGYGFIDEATPELSIAVIPAARRQGVGTMLLGALLDEARRRATPAISLSVEPDNPAVVLYERFGFRPAGGTGGSLTMRWSAARDGPSAPPVTLG